MKKIEYVGIDISKLKPGDVITKDTLDELYEKNIPVGDDHLRKTPMHIFIMDLCKNIESALFNLGRYARCRQKHYDIHVIQGAELSEYTSKQAVRAIGKIMREATIMELVDTSKMDDDANKIHERKKIIIQQHAKVLQESRNKAGLINGVVFSYLQLRNTTGEEW